MALKSDSYGFLLGENRLKEISEGINKTEVNTQEILNIIKKHLSEIKQIHETAISDPGVKTTHRKAIDSEKKQDNAVKTGTAKAENIIIESRKALDSSKEIVKISQKAIDAEKIIQKKEQYPSNNEIHRKRDSNGRFIGSRSTLDSDSVGSGSKTREFIKTIRDATQGVSGSPRGIDPTVDALGELKDVVAPVGTTFSKMSSSAVRIFAGRSRKRKAEQVLPEEQSTANKVQQKNDVRRNKLLERIIDAIRSSRGEGGGGLLGGLLGGGGKGKGKGRGRGGKLGKLLGAGKGLLRKLPLVGSLIGGAMVASEWNELDNKGRGKGVGGLVGGIAGGALGSFLGPAGTVAGGLAGAAFGTYLGGIFGEKVGEWTDSLKKKDFLSIFKNTVEGTLSLAANVLSFPSQLGKMATRAVRGGASAGGIGGLGGLGGYSSESIGYDAKGKKGTLKSSKERQLAMYNALRKAGFSEEQAFAIGGQIGRENDYSDAIFATHVDPAKDENGRDIINGGALSWNNKRYENFKKFMTEKGLMDANGQMPKTQATLDAQAEFIMKEMNSKDYRKKLGGFLDNPHADHKTYEKELGKDYIGWAYGQTTIRGKNGKREPFDSKGQQQKADDYSNRMRELAKQQAAELKAQENTNIPVTIRDPKIPAPSQPKSPSPIKVNVPQITPELTKIGKKESILPMNNGPKDTNMGQNVSDRKLAHIFSGGIGFDN